MDISKWTVDEVLRLPDYAFGERWLVSVTVRSGGAGSWGALSPAALPSVMVVWELSIYFSDGALYPDAIRVFLADELPVTTPAAQACEALIPGLGEPEAGPGVISYPNSNLQLRFPMKKVVRPEGRKLGIWYFTGEIGNYRAMAAAIISTVPKEIPDWLAYHLGISR